MPIFDPPSQKVSDAPIPSRKLIDHFLSFLTEDYPAREQALNELRNNWRDGYVIMVLDVIYFSRDGSAARQLYPLLNEKTKQHFNQDIDQWRHWVWNREAQILPVYADFMAALYKHIDSRFERYFADRSDQVRIRLDEVRWGGVSQDGIPPLRQPKMIKASAAEYLENWHIVFGIEVNGDFRAYPKRILAWHELFVDEVGGVPVAGVYCTLCGTVILYETTHDGKHYELGTSGFLYRSNKLMYDQATQSLWNTISGRPVIGPLVDQDIELNSRSVVTTTWGEWRRRHPDTKVLALETGHARDYDEGVAYRDYFATDELMFHVPKLDQRLKNKAEVLIVRAEGYQSAPLAIAADFLKEERIYHDQIGDTPFVVLTDKSGGNRVYESGNIRFKKLKKRKTVIDEHDGSWQIEEDQLIGPDGQVLKRLPYHRIFWFAWFNSHPKTRLVN